MTLAQDMNDKYEKHKASQPKFYLQFALDEIWRNNYKGYIRVGCATKCQDFVIGELRAQGFKVNKANSNTRRGPSLFVDWRSVKEGAVEEEVFTPTYEAASPTPVPAKPKGFFSFFYWWGPK